MRSKHFFHLFVFLLLVFPLCTSGCIKDSVGRWDNKTIGMEIYNHTRKEGPENEFVLVVNISMTNVDDRESENGGKYIGGTNLPLRAEYFNVYDTSQRVYSCSKLNCSEPPRGMLVKYNESYNVTLTFSTFYCSSQTEIPDVLEYRYENSWKWVRLNSPGSQEDEESIFSSTGIIVALIIIFLIVVLIGGIRVRTR